MPKSNDKQTFRGMDVSEGRFGKFTSPIPHTGVNDATRNIDIARHKLGDLTAPQVVSISDNHRLALDGERLVDSQQIQFYTYWINLPLVENYPLVKSRFLFLQKLVKSWDIQNPEMPWFYVNKKMAILTDEEWDAHFSTVFDEKQWYSTEEVRDRLCERLASFSVTADTLAKMTMGAFANLAIFSRYTGDDGTMRIATELRWNTINRRCHNLGTYMIPKCWDYITAHSHVATGTSPTNAPMFAYPLWITDIWGNRGDHEWDWKSYLCTTKKMGTFNDRSPTEFRSDEIAVDAAITDEDKNNLRLTLRNAYGVADRYAYGAGIRMVNKSGDVSLAAAMPRIENGATWQFSKTEAKVEGEGEEVHVYRVPGNVDCQMRGYVNSSNARYENPPTKRDPVQLNNLTDKLWRNYKFWSTEYESQCQLLTDPETEMARYFEEWGWMEKPRPIHDVWKAIVDSDYDDMEAIAQNMVYRKDSRPVTATIVKVDLPASSCIYQNEKGCMQITDYQDDQDFPYFERFGLARNMNASYEIYAAMRYPSLTPSVFFHNNSYPSALANAHEDDPSNYDHATLYDAVVSADNNGVTPAIWNTVPEYLGNRMPGMLSIRKYNASSPSVQSDIYYAYNSDRTHEDQGPGAVMIDLAKSQTTGTARSVLTTQGVDPNSVVDDINKYAGIIAKENAAKQWVFVQPLFDNTDIYQCGFNAWFNVERIDMGKLDSNYLFFSNWTRGMTKALPFERTPYETSYVNGTYAAEANAKTVFSGDITSLKSDNHRTVAHVGSSAYMHLIKDAFVFVGAAPFKTASKAQKDVLAALPYQQIDTRWRNDAANQPHGRDADPGYVNLSKQIRALRETTASTWVTAAADDWDHGSTDARMVIPIKSSTCDVKVGDRVAALLQLGNDTDFDEFWSFVQKDGLWSALGTMLGRSRISVKYVLATADGTWYNVAAGKRVNEGRVIGRIETHKVYSANIPFGEFFLKNKSIATNIDKPTDAIPETTPVAAAELYDTMANLLNDVTASGALNLSGLAKWMFDPAYGPVLPFTKPDLVSGYIANADNGSWADGTENSYYHANTDQLRMDAGFVPSGDSGIALKYKAAIHPFTNAHRWSREIASIQLDAVVPSSNNVTITNVTPVKRIDYTETHQDADLLDTLEGNIACATAGHLRSINDIIPEINFSQGDEGVVTATGTGPTYADVTNEPKQRNTYQNPSPTALGSFGPMTTGDRYGTISHTTDHSEGRSKSSSDRPNMTKHKSRRRRHMKSHAAETSVNPQSFNSAKEKSPIEVETNPFTKDDQGLSSPSDAQKFDASLKKPDNINSSKASYER